VSADLAGADAGAESSWEATPILETADVAIPVRGMACQSCVSDVRAALTAEPGVLKADVDLATSRALVRYVPALTSVSSLQGAIEAVGYVAGDPAPNPGHPAILTDGGMATSTTATGTAGHSSLLEVLPGLAASTLLVGFYLFIMSIAQGLNAALELLQEDWYLIGALVVGFGVQVGLFVHMRRRHRVVGRGPATAMTGASTGISGVSMLACCAHHLADLLPFLGLTGAAVFLAQYREEFLVVGVVTNLAGIAVMVRMLCRWR